MSDLVIKLPGEETPFHLRGVIDHDTVKITCIEATLSGNRAKLDFKEPITAPRILLGDPDPTNGQYSLRSIKEAAKKKATGALAKLRDSLAKNELKIDADGSAFFGLQGGDLTLEGHVSLSFPELTTENISSELHASVSAKIDINFDIAGYVKGEYKAELCYHVRIINKDVLASIETIIPEAPDLGFSLDNLRLPELSFLSDDLLSGFKAPDLSAIAIPVPDWLGDLITVSGGEKFTLNVGKNGDITFEAGSDLSFKIKDLPIVTIKNFSIKSNGGKINVEGDPTISEVTADPVSIPFGGGTLPIGGKIDIASITFSANTTELTLKWEISNLSIEATEDPDSRIAVKFNLTSITVIKTGKTSWKISDFGLLDLKVDLDIPDMPSIGDLIPFRLGFKTGPIGTPGIPDFLKRLTKIVTAISRYFSNSVGPITGLLSEPTEFLMTTLSEAVQWLLSGLDAAEDYVTLELRLNAKTFRPVQIIVSANKTTRNDGSDPTKIIFGDKLLQLELQASVRPALIFDFRNKWQGLALLYDTPTGVDTLPNAKLSTNLWLEPSTEPASSIAGMGEGQDNKPLLTVTAQLTKEREFVLAAIQNGRARFFQTFGSQRPKPLTMVNGVAIQTVSEVSDLRDFDTDDIGFKIDAKKLKERILSLMPQGPKTSGGPLSELAQSVKVTNVTASPVENGKLKINVTVQITVADLEIDADLVLSLDLATMHFKIEIEEEIFVVSDQILTKSAFGLNLTFIPKAPDKPGEKDTKHLFKITFADGDMRVDLAEGAKLILSYDRLSSNGEGLKLTATKFGIGRGGLDLDATADNTPVRLAGLDQPFRFTSGSISIRGGAIQGGTISGNGPLPPALIGEANAEIDLVFAPRNGRFSIASANAKLEKEGEPLYSTGTKFKIKLDALGLGFVEPDVGPVQFYFTLWGSASFEPGKGQFEAGILKNIRSVSIKLDGAPLTGDGRELLKHISFLVELDPPIRESLFDIFTFELRGIAFYPASKSWPDNPPAIGLNGQISFLEAGDAVSADIDFHELLITIPEPGGNIPLPRIRADGLSVLVRVGGVAQVEATAVAVDGSIPTMYAPVSLPANVKADGFLASGRVDISGLGAFGGAMGLLELSKDGINNKKHAMFLYGQAEKLAERIDTPIGPLFVREVGFGFGKNYTLSAIAAADDAKSPRELVKVLDEVSKLQGNLTNFNAWTPQFDKNAITLALRGMISMTSTSTSSSYDDKGEKELSNPILMDIVLGLRTDMTFYVNVRAWIATNYNDWFTASSGADFKERPTLRGYLYFSLPRKELLARFLSDPTGIVGKHPELPKELTQAIEATRFSSTLYIRPGLYHIEFGWPYELGFDLGDRNGNFFLSLSAGLVFRIEDATMLYGIAFRASGKLSFGGEVGNANFGASAVARVEFLLGARFIAYLAPLSPKDTLFYGEVYLGLTLEFGVAIWMSFKIFRKRFTIRIGFSIYLTISVAAEVVLSGSGIGARVFASVGVRGFGRTLSLGVGFSFGDSALERARARVARFMQLGLGIDPPKAETLYAPPPAPTPEVARMKRAQSADNRLDRKPPPKQPTVPPADPIDAPLVQGLKIDDTNFWALLFKAGEDDNGNDIYLMQLVPCDHSEDGIAGTSTFFAEPYSVSQGGGDIKKLEADEKDISGRVVDYQFIAKSGKSLKGLKHIDPEGKLHDIESITGTRAKLDFQIGNSESGALILNTLLAECFLAGPDKTAEFGEPFRIEHKNPTSEQNIDPQIQRDDQASRLSPGGPKLEASLIAEEKRSALINKIGENAFDVAADARARGVKKLDNIFQDATDKDGGSSELTAPVFGLTFAFTQSTLNDIFEGDGSAVFDISKRVRRNDKWEYVKGTVTLLNHPDKSFDAVEPRLEGACVKRSDDGLKLYWDLEPAFGSSADAAFNEDPETLLAHYRIERSFEGSEVSYTAEFKTRTATPVKVTKEGEEENSSIKVERSRAQMHLSDDLSHGGIPQDLRAMLSGTPIPSKSDPRDVWSAHFGVSRKISIIYKVVAVDCLGTETGLRVIEYEIERPAFQITPALNAELTVNYHQGISRLGEPANDASLDLTLIFADEDKLRAAKENIIHIRTRAYALMGGGEYGSDALDDSKNRPSQQDIDQQNPGDKDIYLIRSTSEKSDFKIKFLLSGEEDEKAEQEYYVAVKTLSDAHSSATGSDHDAERDLLRALNIPQGIPSVSDLKATRVFLRQIEDSDQAEPMRAKSTWLIAQTHLLVPAKTKKDQPLIKLGQPFTATVEQLEVPLNIEFNALEQTQIERNYGRLELVYPNANASLESLIEGVSSISRQNSLIRRTDPDRRSAIHLDFNVSSAKLRDDASNSVASTELNGLIAGFDVFAADPARLRIRAEQDGGLTPEIVAKESHRRTTVKVLPRSLSGLYPDSLPNFRAVEARYPSDTQRTDPTRRGKRQRARWYSGAESLVVFPAQRLRRSLFSNHDEAMIAALLDEVKVQQVRVEHEFIVSSQELSQKPIQLMPDMAATDSDLDVVKVATPLTALNNDVGIRSAELRAYLRGLVLGSDSADREYSKWRRDGSPKEEANKFIVKVTLISESESGDTLRKETVEVNLAINMHPVLADTIDTLAFAPFGSDPGEIYRAYEVVREPAPTLEQNGFDAFLDAYPQSADPYGWAALRSMGLASGFRLYDIENGRFVSGQKLLKKVTQAFQAAIKRYVDENQIAEISASDINLPPSAIDRPTNLGTPFVELIDLPDSFMGLSSHNGRDVRAATDNNRIIEGNTSILQIALRPRPTSQLLPVKKETAPSNQLTEPVRYLMVQIENVKVLAEWVKEEQKNKKWELKNSVIYDFVGLPLQNGEAATRFAGSNSPIEQIFPDSERIGSTLRPDFASLTSLQKGTMAFAIRVSALKSDLDFNAVLTGIKAIFEVTIPQNREKGLKVSDWITHPGQKSAWITLPKQDKMIELPVFDLFETLDPPLLAALTGTGSGLTETVQSLIGWLPAKHHPERGSLSVNIKLGDKNAYDFQKVTAFAPRAQKFHEWTQRFLQHGSGQMTKDGDAKSLQAVRFALASIMSEESYARAPDVNGKVTAFLIDSAQIGREIYFSIRPYGRYVGIERIVGEEGERPVTLEGGLSEDWYQQFAAVSLPRSKELVSPTVLAARASNEASNTGTTGIELVVARTPDQIASAANIRAERALQGAWTGIELRGNYLASWVADILLAENIDLLKELKELDLQPAASNAPERGDIEILTPSELKDLRTAAPDSWRGSIRYDIRGLPHFLETTALLHQSAGVVVSDVTAVQLPRPGFILRFPPFKPETPDETDMFDIRRSPGWGGGTHHPTWSSSHVITVMRERTQIHFDLPMMRNLDLMPNEDLWAWTDGNPARVTSIYRLPEAKVSYRIGTASADLSSTTTQIEILPAQALAETENNASDIYLASLTGERFNSATKPIVSKEGNDKNPWFWRLSIVAECASLSMDKLGNVDIKGNPIFATIADIPNDFEPALWARAVPRRTIEFTVTNIDAANIAPALEYLSVFQGDQIIDTLHTLIETDLEIDTHIKSSLPLGFNAQIFNKLTSTLELGEFKWPELETIDGQETQFDTKHPIGLSYPDHKKALIYGSHLTNKTVSEIEAILMAAKNHWQTMRKAGRGGLGPLYVRKVGISHKNLPLPFTQFDLKRYSNKDGFTSGQRDALIDEVLLKFTSDPVLAATAIDTLERLEIGTAGVVGATDVVLPVPIGKKLAVDDVLEKSTKTHMVGCHWLPDRKAFDALEKDGPVNDQFYQISNDLVFGKNAVVQFSGFKDSAPAQITTIKQKGRKDD
ncbi:MAG: hypothetical protein ABJO86_13205 [Lentilitoribacter sp.]